MPPVVQKVARMQLYVGITRVDDEKRIVEGTAFANETVPGEGGLRLKKDAMKAATPDYAKFGAIREMHRSEAAGTITPNDPELAKECGVDWIPDDTGKEVARVKAYISDDDAWKKVKDGTYKGFSVGVSPTKMRGKDVEACTWYETSLVDRPKDPDAMFSMVRGESADDLVECEILEEDPIQRAEDIERTKWTKAKRDALDAKYFGDPEGRKFPIQDQDDVDSAAKLISKADDPEMVKKRITKIAKELKLMVPDAWKKMSKRTEDVFEIHRGKFADMAKKQLPSSLRYLAIDMLDSVLQSIAYDSTSDPATKENMIREALGEFTDFIVPVVAAQSWPDSDLFDDIEDIDNDNRAAMPTLDRVLGFKTAAAESLKRAGELQTEVESLQRSVADNLQTVSTLTIERDDKASELLRVQESLSAAEEKVKSLESQPRGIPPVRFPEAYERTLAMQKEKTAPDRERLEKELQSLSRMAASADMTEANTRMVRIQQIKHELAQLG